MAADYNKPISTDNYLDILTQLRDNITAGQSLLNDLTGVTNIPTGALRYDQTAKKFQIYNGTTFVDTVLSKEAGGTGITNWVKATTGEAEAGTPNKYPDAAAVLAAIVANSFDGGSPTLIWSGSSTVVDIGTTIEGGFYVIVPNYISTPIPAFLTFHMEGFQTFTKLPSTTGSGDFYILNTSFVCSTTIKQIYRL